MEPSKKKILVFIDWYLPGFKAGGPIRSCVSLVDRLKHQYHFKIITGNTDLKDTSPYPDIKSDTWNTLANGTEVFYCSSKFLNYKNIKKLLLDEMPDIIYLNSMYSPFFTLLPLIAAKRSGMDQKIIVAPRGMLSKGALALKPLKKQLFLTLTKLTGLFRNSIFHASSEIEVNETKAVFGTGARIFHAMNLTPKSSVTKVHRIKQTNKVKLVYLGRISEVKNLMQALKVIRNTNNNLHFELDVYGPPENKDYLELCEQEIATMPGHVKVRIMGGVDNSGIRGILSQYHFLFLLTMNENFGHAIVEGLSAGCPVIISDRTPWRNLEEKKCGWDLSLNDDDKIVETLNYTASMNQDEYNTWSDAAYAFAETINENIKAVDDHITMFESVK